MTDKELDSWFCSLGVKQKEHIACKVLLKKGLDAKQGLYPNSINIWNSLDAVAKNTIHDHCTDRHGMWSPKDGDGPVFSF